VAITLGGITFDDANTTVRESYEEVGGRDARRIELTGLITGELSPTAIETQLDAIISASSSESYDAQLSLRPGRRLLVRRAKFAREVCRATNIGRFSLTLEAQNPFEEEIVNQTYTWNISSSGVTHLFQTGGNVYARPSFVFYPSADVVNPVLSDGTRRIAFSGVMKPGQMYLFDGPKQQALLGVQDLTCYTTGSFPRIQPGESTPSGSTPSGSTPSGSTPSGTTLTYTDDAASSHALTLFVYFPNRWW
jgi:hypothetical protein